MIYIVSTVTNWSDSYSAPYMQFSYSKNEQICYEKVKPRHW